ncbi:MAG: DUF3888 domain-containing protein [Oscillospiraceae bacterium]|nr:DUF3888 domain-containing protein [Oscillospiraceae bacterium]
MRKFILFAAGLMAAAAILLSTGSAAESKSELPQDAVEQVILRLLHQPVKDAVNDYYDGPRQYWKQEVLSVQKVPQSPYYKVVIRVETFYGPHNPPYGLETMIFHVGPLDEVRLTNFEHQDEPE